jgi:hypothetical protein
MPNWVEQVLHVVGPKAELDHFIHTGFIPHARGEMDDLIDFTRLCPLKKRERKDTYTHSSGVVLSHFRTRTQAMFMVITSWDYPAKFYARLARQWPELVFVCAVNEDMGQFGGVIMMLNGEHVDLVRDYDADYRPRAHAREVRALLKRWYWFLTVDRSWRLIADVHLSKRSIPYDAHFDDDGWFYFRTREELAQFRARYRSRHVMHRVKARWRRALIRPAQPTPLLEAR